jgi:radical SAM superfamily enzyme YgiQ (UPF0313 family)
LKITLIEPAMIKRDGFSEKPMFTLQPLTLAVLAGLTPARHEIQAIDDRIETINYDEPRDLVGISVQTFTARRAYQIADEFRRRQVPVVLGGYHPTLLPSEASQHADSVVLGEAEGVWRGLLEDVECGRMQPIYQANKNLPLIEMRVDRTVFKNKRYLPATLLETARGCLHDCAFCAVTAFSGREHRCRPVEEVIVEIEGLGKDFVFFVDDNIIGNHQAAKALLQALIPLKIRWIGQASLTMTRDLELLQLMQKSGCQGVLVGMETLDPANLRQIDKSWNIAKIGYPEALKIARDHGIAIVASFILGLDEDTDESLEATAEFAVQQRFFAVLFNLLMPYPGTRLYAELLAQGRLTRPNWWIDPEYIYGSAVFEPKRIRAERLAEKRIEMYQRFYGTRSTVWRVLDRQANTHNLLRLLIFLSLNLPANRQETRRFGKRLGADQV